MARQQPPASASPAASRTAEPEPAQARERIRSAQEALNKLGYPVGALNDPNQGVTGEWSEQTRLAVSEFQEEFGLVTSGELDEETYAIIMGAGGERTEALRHQEGQSPSGEPIH